MQLSEVSQMEHTQMKKQVITSTRTTLLVCPSSHYLSTITTRGTLVLTSNIID